MALNVLSVNVIALGLSRNFATFSFYNSLSLNVLSLKRLFLGKKLFSPYLAGLMGEMFSYFEGSLEDFLAHIKEIKDNRLVKIRLVPVESFCHVLDNFAVNHIITKHANERFRKSLRTLLLARFNRRGLGERLSLIPNAMRTSSTLMWKKSGKAGANWPQSPITNEKGNSPTLRVHRLRRFRICFLFKKLTGAKS